MKFPLTSFILFTCVSIGCGGIAAQVTAPAGTRHAATGKDKEPEKIKLGEDEPGCKDSALLARVPGCSIIQCDTKEADGLEIQVGVSQDGNIQKESMDGAAEIIYYLCPARITLPQIAKLSETGLSRAGYKTVYYGKDGDEFPIVTMLKENHWVQLSTYMYDDYSAYIQTALKVPLENQASTDALAEEMAKTGRITLRGLTFANEEEISAESEKTMSDILAFLVRQPEMRVRVEGHTDTAADKNANMVLSQKQASAVASWLLSHGIDKSRLSIQGLGDSKPLDHGNTPEAKTKNRRVELLPF
jgi:outer membrane protein OmpA-like peptidoglycan-associated protein